MSAEVSGEKTKGSLSKFHSPCNSTLVPLQQSSYEWDNIPSTTKCSQEAHPYCIHTGADPTTATAKKPDLLQHANPQKSLSHIQPEWSTAVPRHLHWIPHFKLQDLKILNTGSLPSSSLSPWSFTASSSFSTCLSEPPQAGNYSCQISICVDWQPGGKGKEEQSGSLMGLGLWRQGQEHLLETKLRERLLAIAMLSRRG